MVEAIRKESILWGSNPVVRDSKMNVYLESARMREPVSVFLTSFERERREDRRWSEEEGRKMDGTGRDGLS